jgi:anti-sigma factor RsiW
MLQPEMRCREFVEAVTEWMEGALDDDERVVLEEHLAICPHCLDYLGELRLAIAALRRTAGSSSGPDRLGPPPAVREALLTAFRQQRR